MAIVVTRMMAGRSGRLPADWSWQRKAALIVFALIMAYLHSFYVLGFYVSDMEYWGTVWIGVTAEQRLLSFALGLFANLGLMAMPFLRTPGWILRAFVALALAFGLLISVGWLSHDVVAWLTPDVDTLGLPETKVALNTESIFFFFIDILFLILPTLVKILYAATICVNALFLLSLARMS